MAHLIINNHDAIFHNLTQPAIIANDWPIDTKEGRDRLNKQLYTRYEGDSLNVVPSCDCGHVKGGHKVGIICGDCSTVCENVIERPLESTVWLRVPDGVRGFINPAVWLILSNKLKQNGCNVLEWLTNPYYAIPGKIPTLVKRLEKNAIPRGLNNFIDNFDFIMELLFCEGYTLGTFENAVKQGFVSKEKNLTIVRFINMYKHNFFSTYLPMPSKVGFVVESNETGAYVDKTITEALNALYTITSIKSSLNELSLPRLESRTIKCITQMARYYDTFVDENLSKKPGIFRKHIFGIRLHFTARAVITSISDNHKYDQLAIPWNIGIQLLGLHLSNKMIRDGFTPLQIERYLREHTFDYDPYLDSLFHDLINSTVNRGLPCILQRNPSLARGSAQYLFISKIKTDPSDNTFSLSTLILVGFNADFDGDELNLMLINDHEMAEGLSKLAPHQSTLDATESRALSSNTKLPPPVSNTINNYLYTETRNYDWLT